MLDKYGQQTSLLSIDVLHGVLVAYHNQITIHSVISGNVYREIDTLVVYRCSANVPDSPFMTVGVFLRGFNAEQILVLEFSAV